MQFFDITIGVNGIQKIATSGSFVYFLTGSAGGADTTITLKNMSGSETMLLKPGQAVRIDGSRGGMVEWVIGNYKNQAPIIGQLLIGDGEFEDNRISGSVEVIDGGKARTQADTAKIGRTYYGGSAGNYAYNQLWNPAASGKNIYIEQVSIFSSGTLGSGAGLAGAMASIGTVTGNPSSKRIGGVASAAELRTYFDAVQLAPTFMTLDKTARTYTFSEPLLLSPGTGITVQGGLLSESLGTTFEFFEEAVG